MFRSLPWLAAAVIAGGALSGCGEPQSAQDPITQISADLHTHIAKLASDDFEGRAPATRGEELTIGYLAEQFSKLGLKPGNGTSWFQKVPVVEMVHESTPMEIRGEGFSQTLQYGDDMMTFTQRQSDTAALEESELVFVGYGVVAPEYDWNDYAGIDMAGKTAVILVNDPGYATQDAALFNGNAMTYYGRWTYKFEEAARQGAAGAILIHEDAAAGYPWAVVSGSWSGAQISLKSEDGNPNRAAVESWITQDVAKALFAGAGLDYAALLESAKSNSFEPQPMGLRASVSLKNTLRTSESNNVIAKIEGSERPEEAVIFTAHWDHIGIKPGAEGGDHIFNGAVDNATGTAGLLAIARQLKEAEPARSILFVAVTAEESGLLGSKYYAENPVVPLETTVGGVNFDAMSTYGQTRDIMVVGHGNSELEKLLDAQAQKYDRYTKPAAGAEKGYFYRSDHFSLAKKGVPMLYFKSGTETTEHDHEWAEAQAADYGSRRYHKPADEYDPNWDLSGAASDLFIGAQIALELANSDAWPNWYPGNEFRAIRDASEDARK